MVVVVVVLLWLLWFQVRAAAAKRDLHPPSIMNSQSIVAFLHECRLADILSPRNVTRVFFLTSSDKHRANEVAQLLIPTDPVEWDVESALRQPTTTEAPFAAVLYRNGAAEVLRRPFANTMLAS